MSISAITITGPEQAALLPADAPEPLGADEVRGHTLASLVSPGTELSANYLGKYGEFPNTPGYAAVFQAEEIGRDVNGISPGARLFCMGGHRSLQQHRASGVVPVPQGVAAEEMVLARLMGVTLTTLRTTKAAAGDLVLITGAGPVGYLCAHLFKNSGYDVLVVDPDSRRRKFAEESGIQNVWSRVPEDEGIKGKVGLAVECSGHEQAVFDAAKAVRKGGEVVLVGVPWQKRTELDAHELLSIVFHNFVLLRSGWEWQLPRYTSDFNPHSIFNGFHLALRWLAEGRIPTKGLITLQPPKDAQNVYQDLLHGRGKGLFQVFDWRSMSDKST